MDSNIPNKTLKNVARKWDQRSCERPQHTSNKTPMLEYSHKEKCKEENQSWHTCMLIFTALFSSMHTVKILHQFFGFI
jgi:hypothetical protein